MPKDAENSRSEDADEERSEEAAGTPSEGRSSKVSRRADDEENEDEAPGDEDGEDEETDEPGDEADEDEEHEADEDERVSRAYGEDEVGRGDEYEDDTRPASPAARRAQPVNKRRARRPAPLTEKEINSPDAQTLWMLGLLALVTLILWGMARFACNAHPPQVVKPRKVSTQELARDPKDAAIELQQRWATKHYSEALELASGSAAAELQKDEKACNAHKTACKAQRKKLAGAVMTTGMVLSREPGAALVRVTSRGPAGKQSYVIHLRPSASIWKADWRKSGTAAPRPAAAPAASAK